MVGDAKTYNHLVELKRSYGQELSWLLPLPGDWHILKNFQPVLFKAYYDAGLKQIAEKCGFHQSTLTALSQCSNFRTTHNFLMQICEAIFQHMLTCFMKHRNGHTLLQNFPSNCFQSCNSRHSGRHKQRLYP